MGDSWTQIAEPIRRMHGVHAIVRARGHFRVGRGRHPLARLLARMLRLPQSSPAAETRLIVTPDGDGEHWQRIFDGRRFETRQYKSAESELAERFGVLELKFRLDASGGSLVYVQREAALVFGLVRLPIPGSCAPHVNAAEAPAGPHSVKVDVRVTLPRAGVLIAYDGIIDVEMPQDGPSAATGWPRGQER